MSNEQTNRDPRHYLLFLAVTDKTFSQERCKTIMRSSKTDLTSVLKRQLNAKQALGFLEVTDAYNHLG